MLRFVGGYSSHNVMLLCVGFGSFHIVCVCVSDTVLDAISFITMEK